ncbi:hypothetical protein AVEN_235349-1 [Araneus ventricosus]|uniref:Uncharacterized protein n=1 Tax=Araneus ventricosus TaxID=182803 RepID=A0A4Y2A3F2_ARAVE|nr:hypothetical protein AVEN_235349-1 [Araneus ventricosus]
MNGRPFISPTTRSEEKRENGTDESIPQIISATVPVTCVYAIFVNKSSFSVILLVALFPPYTHRTIFVTVYTADLRWNRGTKLEPFCPEIDSLPPVDRRIYQQNGSDLDINSTTMSSLPD